MLPRPVESGRELLPGAGRLRLPSSADTLTIGGCLGQDLDGLPVLTVGRPRDLLQARHLIAAGAEVDPARLADPAIALKDAAR